MDPFANPEAKGDDGSFSMSDDEDLSDTVSISEKLTLALSCKDEGTRRLKDNDVAGACAMYKEGLKKLGHADDIDLGTSSDDESSATAEERKKARIALNLNLALCYVKLGNWIDAIHASNAVLKIEKENLKALYRRGLARSRVGFLEEARDDLIAACRLDPTNNDARRELAGVKQRLAEARARDKQTFNGLFAKAEGLYGDKARAVEKQKQLEEEQRRKELKEFEEINKAREARGETPYASFEVWKSEKKEEEKKQQRSTSHKRAAEPAPPKPSGSSPVGGTSSGGTVELDEEDQKILMETKKMGYCYFNRPKTEDAPVVKPVPTKLDGEALGHIAVSDSTHKSLSSWNAAGTTYEELDCSSWFRDKLQERLRDTMVKTAAHCIKVDTITDIAGEAQVVVLRSSKRYLYDMSFKLGWTLTLDDATIAGTMALADVASTASSRPTNTSVNGAVLPDWLADAKVVVSSSYDAATYEHRLKAALLDLKLEVATKMKLLEEDFKSRA